MNICIIDNYDSFTYNLSHAIKSLGAEVTVLRNDKFNIGDLEKFDKLVLSPGPGIPSEAGLLTEVVRHYADHKPILGVCLGEQTIVETARENGTQVRFVRENLEFPTKRGKIRVLKPDLLEKLPTC